MRKHKILRFTEANEESLYAIKSAINTLFQNTEISTEEGVLLLEFDSLIVDAIIKLESLHLLFFRCDVCDTVDYTENAGLLEGGGCGTAQLCGACNDAEEEEWAAFLKDMEVR